LYYVDGLIGEVLQQLHHRGLDDDTIVIVTSDHGEEFNDNHKNYWGHGSNFSDVQVHVPLFIRWPGKAPQIINYRTWHLDIVPTLMQDALGVVSNSAIYSIGRNLFDPDGTTRHFIIGSYYNYAIVSPDELDVASPDGQESTLSPMLNPLGRSANRKALQKAIEQMSRFYRTTQ
jgi:uncharacterized protein